MAINRFGIYLVDLNPTIGSEINKVRPCLVVSPDEMNHHIHTIIVAPMTTQGKAYPTRVTCKFKGKVGRIALDQIRTVDQERLIKKMGQLNGRTASEVLTKLEEMFAP